MKSKEIKSIRPFLGSEDFNQSRKFYNEIGFTELPLSEKMSFFQLNEFGFYLQDYFVKDWIENSMVFLEVEDLEIIHNEILGLDLTIKFEGVKISEIHHNEWGNEFFMHDPSDILWHIGTFNA